MLGVLILAGILVYAAMSGRGSSNAPIPPPPPVPGASQLLEREALLQMSAAELQGYIASIQRAAATDGNYLTSMRVAQTELERKLTGR